MSNGQSGSMQEMIIPAGKAGLIIGKGGETIKQLQVKRCGHFYSDFNKSISHQREIRKDPVHILNKGATCVNKLKYPPL